MPYRLPVSTGVPKAAANWPNRPTHALRSEVKLLAWLMPARSPAGVVTRSTSGCRALSLCSRTTIAKMEVPAETLPVRTRTELVATMPVPASPSGGARTMPGCRVPVGSSSLAPSAVSVPAGVPATSGSGSRSERFHGFAATSGNALNFSMNSVS